MRRINQALWRMAAAWYPVVVPTVVSINSTAQTEGTSIVHSVVLSSVVSGSPASYPFSITPVTASTPSDYTATPTFNNGVTLSAGYLSVPVGVLSFTITVATSQDMVYEGTETYTVTVGGMSNTGTINDDDSAPTIFSVSSATGAEGSSVIHTVTVSGSAQAARTFALSFTNGTATGGGVDYTSTLTNSNFSAGVTISGGNISLPPGVATFSVYVPATTDALTESSETYTLAIGGASGVGTITDAAPIVSGYGATADTGRVDTPGTAAAWSVVVNYDAGALVQNGGSAFWAIIAVPSGTATSNTTYWQPVALTYYVDADNGNDTTYNGQSRYLGYVTNADGSQGSANAAYGPWQTLTKLREVALSGYWDTAAPNGSTYPTNHAAWPSNTPRGTLYLLKRGTASAYAGQLQAAVWNATAVASIGDVMYGTYGTGARPLVNYVQSLNYYSNSGAGASWTRPGTKLDNINLDMQYAFSCTVAPGTGTFATDDVVSQGSATGIVQHLNGTSLTIRCTSMPAMFTSGAIQTASAVKTGTISAINYTGGYSLVDINKTVQDGSVSNALGIGILFSVGTTTPPNNSVVKNMTVSNTCREQATGAGIDGGGSSASYIADNLQVLGNTCFDNGNGGLSHNIYLAWMSNSRIANNWCYMTQGGRGNHACVIHGNVTNLVIEDNLFEFCTNGLGINDGYGSAETMDNIDVRRNINRNHGYATNGDFLNQGQLYELACVTNSRLYNNVNSNTVGPAQLATKRNSGGSDAVSANVSFCHETYYNVLGGLKLRSVYSTTLTGIVLKNNILMSTAPTGYILDIDSTTPTGSLTLANCLFWAPNNAGSAINWFGTPYTIDDWLAGPGAGLGCIKADPLFTNAATNDFTLQVGSPCKNAGVPVLFATTDLAGNARSATTPSIGAYE